MATQLKGLTEPAKRQDSFRVNPFDVKTGADARCVPAPNQDELDLARAFSIATHGQQQPIPVRKLKDGTLETVAGNTRHRAVKLWREGFKGPDGRFYQDKEATLWVTVENGVTDYEAFVRGLVENVQRNDMTDVQEAEANRVLRDTYKKSETEIAAIYGRTNTNRVAALRRLLEQPADVVDLVRTGKLALNAALDLSALPEADRSDAVAAATKSSGKVDGAVIRKKLVENQVDALVVTKRTKRTVKNFKDFVKDAQANTDKTGLLLLERLAAWFDGRIGDKALWNTINEECGE